MKGSIIGILGVIIIVIVVGMVLLRSDSEEALAPDNNEVPFVDESEFDGEANDFETQPTSLADEGDPTPVVEETSQPANGASGDTVTIEITDTGFEPSEVEIEAGTTVRFVNNGQALHWPASDVHPTHQVLPEFDANRGLATGETYSYTFTQTGTWPMHDHLFPQFTGEITVE